MRSLLDVSVLVALGDVDHAHYPAVNRWLESAGQGGWASCAITENGMVRILSQPSYPNPVSPRTAISVITRTCANTDHEYWPCDVTLRDSSVVDPSRVMGPRQVTDIYLLALAVAHGGRFVTLDRAVTLAAVPGATPEQLVVL